MFLQFNTLEQAGVIFLSKWLFLLQALPVHAFQVQDGLSPNARNQVIGFSCVDSRCVLWGEATSISN